VRDHTFLETRNTNRPSLRPVYLSLESSNAVLQNSNTRAWLIFVFGRVLPARSHCLGLGLQIYRLAKLPDMALSAPALPGRSEVERRHVQWSRELKEMELAFAHEEREELAALDVAKHAIEVEYQKDREYLISQMPGGMVLPELFDNLLAEKKATALAKKQEEFAKQNTERKKRFEESKLEHLNKWRTSLFVAGPSPSVSCLKTNYSISAHSHSAIATTTVRSIADFSQFFTDPRDFNSSSDPSQRDTRPAHPPTVFFSAISRGRVGSNGNR